MSALRVALLVACLSTALGMPSWYSCNPANCTGDCACASTSPPGGLSPEETPQFIVLTHDDAITADTNTGIRAIIDKHTNRNGCNMPATFYVLEVGTRCELAKAFWEENSEIAIHSKTHLPITDPFPGGPSKMRDEMFHARTFLNETCGIPLEDMVGYRAPQLVHNPPLREMLASAQPPFLYDSSIPDFWGENSEISPNSSDRLWPYSMDYGIPQDCAYFAGDNCTEQERYPGLWEFPLLNTQAENGTLLYSMDPGTTGGDGGYTTTNDTSGLPADELEALLKQNFDYSYYGNRAPYGLYIHTPWLTPGNIQAANNFLAYALGLNNTWVVTVRQVIAWMQDPVPASEMDNWLTCQPVDLTKAPGVQKCQVYTVKAGDTGDKISGMFGVDLSEVEALNPNLASLQPGDKIKIPPFDSSCGAGIPAAGPDGAAAPAPASGARRLLRGSSV
ncbi:hypothetical protein ABPG77_003946 [Micractinium sp. CCAP 211/92]